jgi:hypothetical protein
VVTTSADYVLVTPQSDSSTTLVGTTKVHVDGGWANFSNLAVRAHPGSSYVIIFEVFPSVGLNQTIWNLNVTVENCSANQIELDNVCTECQYVCSPHLLLLMMSIKVATDSMYQRQRIPQECVSLARMEPIVTTAA